MYSAAVNFQPSESPVISETDKMKNKTMDAASQKVQFVFTVQHKLV